MHELVGGVMVCARAEVDTKERLACLVLMVERGDEDDATRFVASVVAADDPVADLELLAHVTILSRAVRVAVGVLPDGLPGSV